MSETAASVAERHRALSNPTRVRLLEVVRQGGHGIDATSVAQQVGLHANTVRAHLEMLEKVGLVTSDFEERHRQGRPRRLYRSAPSSQPEQPAESAYIALALALAASMDDADVDAAQIVADAGARWGRELMHASPTHAVGMRTIRTELVALLDRLGFAAAPDPSGRIDLHRCPFADVAREHPDVVCGLHQGILTGALEVLDFDGAVRLEPFVTPTTCAVWLEQPAGDPS